MEITAVIIADAANQCVGGKVNVLGIFQNIATPDVPTSVPCAIVVMMRAVLGEKGTEHRVRVCIQDPEGDEIGHAELEFAIPVDIPAAEPHFQWLLPIPRLIIPTFGPHRLVVQLDGNDVRQVDIPVVPVEAPPVEHEP